MQNNKQQKPIIIKIKRFKSDINRKKRKIYLTSDLLPFEQIKKMNILKKQPITPYTDWINRQNTKSHACDKFVTNS